MANIVSKQLDNSSIDVTPNGDLLVIDDPAVLTAIKALHQNCVVTITVSADCPEEPPKPGETIGDHVHVNLGCKGSVRVETPADRSDAEK